MHGASFLLLIKSLIFFGLCADIIAEPINFQAWKGGDAPIVGLGVKSAPKTKNTGIPHGLVGKKDTPTEVVHDEDNIVFISKEPKPAPKPDAIQRAEDEENIVYARKISRPVVISESTPAPAPAPPPPPLHATKQQNKAKSTTIGSQTDKTLSVPARKNKYGNGFNNVDTQLWEYFFTNKTVWEGELASYHPRSCRDSGPLSDYEYESCKRTDRDAFLTTDILLPPITDEASLIIALTHWCSEERDLQRNPAEAFFASYGSVLECVIMLSREIKRVRGGNKYYIHELVDLWHPIVPIPPVDKASNPRLARMVQMSDATCSVPFEHPENWMNKLAEKAVSYHAQSTQDGVLVEILLNIKPTNSFYIEIGYNDDAWVEGSNCFTLNQLFNWDGLLLDGKFSNPAINLHQHYVYPHNILDIFEKYNVPANPDYISVDIDSQDLWLARKILSSERYRPRVMSIEYNCHLPIGSTVTMPPGNSTWNRVDLFYGTSAGAIKLMAAEFDYEVVHFAGTMDIFLVQKGLLGGLCPPSFASFANRVEMLHTCVDDPGRKHKWIEYSTYMQLVEADLEMKNPSGNCKSVYECEDPFILETAQNAALEQYLLMTKVSENYASTASCAGFI